MSPDETPSDTPVGETPPQAPTPPAPPAEPHPTPPPIAGFQQPQTPPAEQPAAPPLAGVPAAAPESPAVSGPSAPSQEPERHSVAATLLFAAIVAVVIAGLVGLAAGFVGARLAASNSSFSGATVFKAPSTITVIPPKTTEPIVAAAAVAVPSVVNIDVSGGATSTSSSSANPAPFEGNGSGVAIKAVSGGGTYIITNNHVTSGANSIVVRSPSGQSWPAKLIGGDPDTDIAVVQISGKLPVISVADSNKLLVGQTAVAIGSPFGLDHSVTFGVISALGRSLPDFANTASGQYPLVDVIQTDAAINPGNSGGALVDRTGRLIGINSAIVGASGSLGQAQNAGIGFAIPSNTALKVAGELISKGTVAHPFIGVIGVTVDSALQAAHKLTVSEGAFVVDFSPGSTAKAAGIKKSDVIVSVNGQPIRSMSDLILQIRRTNVGDTAQIEVVRGTQHLTIGVKIGEKPTSLSAPSSQPTAP